MLEMLIQPIAGLLDKFIPDADEKARLAHQIATMSETYAQERALQQIELNKQEAKGNWFQSGWRPATGWCCVIAMFSNFAIAPWAQAFGITIPQADISVMMPVLLGMLGLGGLRSFERVRGVDRR
jgi:hypothetical protein